MESLFKRLLDYYQISEDDYRSLTMPVDEKNFFLGHSFKDMDKCVEVVKKAVKENKKIFIYGDYDADGIMSVSILVKMFQYLNYPVSYHVPNRYLDGYGLTLKRSEEIVNNGFDLLITVDNGITAFEGIEYAKNHGLEVLIFDHHHPDTVLPKADYILHPFVSEFGEDASSAGFVTFMFALNYLGYFDQYLATLAAISLVSDMMPLVSYNRNLLRLAIALYKKHSFFAIDLLKDKEPFNEISIGMKIAPKINAIGRLIDDDNYLSRTVEFFTSEDKNLLLNYNEWINSVNDERKGITKEASEDSKDVDTSKAAIVTIIDQKEGIIGLIANGFVKKYCKPVVVFALDQSGEYYKGSSRAPKGFNVVDAFNQMGDLLVACGGHALAGGCTIKKENYEAFKEAFIAMAEKTEFTQDDTSAIPLYINDINMENYELVSSFSPFGESWPAPQFKLSRIKASSLMYSRDMQHILTSIGNSARLTGFYFSKEKMSEYQYVDMIGTLRLSTFFNKVTVEFLISDIVESKK